MADCRGCEKAKENMDPVPYIVHEADMARQERTIKRLWVLLILLIVLFVGSNIAWIVYESQFEDVVVEQEVDTGEGDANVTGVGDINNG
jgi:MFS-type transporter involved in bile tolerance (Atg22 family)